jgi:hypothetical protein
MTSTSDAAMPSFATLQKSHSDYLDTAFQKQGRFRKWTATAPFVAALLVSHPAAAWHECAVTPKTIYVGDSSLWIEWNQGGWGMVAQSSPDYKAMLTMAYMAVGTERGLRVRYDDGVSCTAVGGAMRGLTLVR